MRMSVKRNSAEKSFTLMNQGSLFKKICFNCNFPASAEEC